MSILYVGGKNWRNRVKYSISEEFVLYLITILSFFYLQLSLESTLMNIMAPMCLLAGKNGLDYLKILVFTTTLSVEME